MKCVGRGNKARGELDGWCTGERDFLCRVSFNWENQLYLCSCISGIEGLRDDNNRTTAAGSRVERG